jgi:hypothetical protein
MNDYRNNVNLTLLELNILCQRAFEAGMNHAQHNGAGFDEWFVDYFSTLLIEKDSEVKNEN